MLDSDRPTDDGCGPAEHVQIIGVPDERFGAELCAWVAMRPGTTTLDAAAVKDFCAGKLSHFKIPRFVMVVDDFPMAVTNKIRKVEMRETASQQLGL